MPKITITDDRHSRVVPVMHNGRLTNVPVGEECEVSDHVVTALSASSIAFALVEDGGGSLGVTEPSPDPLDHDGDGRRGGSKRGAASTRAKGARRARKAKKD